MKRFWLFLAILSLAVLPATPIWAVGGDVVSAAASRVTEVMVTNWPAVQATEEQNKDADGNIRVHEQGTVQVAGQVGVYRSRFLGQFPDQLIPRILSRL